MPFCSWRHGVLRVCLDPTLDCELWIKNSVPFPSPHLFRCLSHSQGVGTVQLQSERRTAERPCAHSHWPQWCTNEHETLGGEDSPELLYLGEKDWTVSQWSSWFCPMRDFLFSLSPWSCLITPTNHSIEQYVKKNGTPGDLGRSVQEARRVRSYAWGNEKSRRQHLGGAILEENTVSSAIELIGMCLNLSKSESRDRVRCLAQCSKIWGPARTTYGQAGWHREALRMWTRLEKLHQSEPH